MEVLLKEKGFWEERNTTHGTFWNDGYSRILLARQSTQDSHASRNLKADINRAVRKREAMQLNENREPRRKIVIQRPPSNLASTQIEPLPKQSDFAPKLTAQLGELISKPVEKIELKKEKPELDFRLLELYELEKSQPEITKIIASEGYTSSLGTPYSKAWVSARMVTLGLRRREPREKKEEPVSFSKHEYPHATGITMPAPLPAPAAGTYQTHVIHGEQKDAFKDPNKCTLPHVTNEMLAILRDPNLSDAKKVKLLTVWME